MGELAEERAVISRIIQQAGYQPFLYEWDANARPWNHEETFVQELRAANLYVGIFWNKYGPYTVQEFQLAQERGIPRLVFEKASASGKRDTELQEFLDRYNKVTGSEAVTIARFTSVSELEERFRESFKSFLAEMAKRGWRGLTRTGDSLDSILPKDLPCLCDRDPQEIYFEEQVTSYFTFRSTRPLLLILPGPVQEKHGLYLNRIKLCSLEEYLTKAGLRGEKKVIQIRKSPCAMISPRHLGSEILSVLQEQETGHDGVIVDHVRKKRLKALLVVIRLLTSECEGNPQKPLQLIADYLAAFPDTSENVLISVVVCLEEDRESVGSQRWWKRFWKGTGSSGSGLGPCDQLIRKIQQRYQDGSKVRVEILPHLTSPKLVDVRRWLDHELVKSSVPYMQEEEIQALFQGRDSLPMDDLYLKLTDLLERGPKK